MAEIRVTYNPESIKNISELNGMKGKNLVANEIYANEDWLDSDQDGDNPFNHEVSGTEFLNFAKHIDTNGDNKITDTEIENWRSSNKGVGNSAHKSFSDEEVVVLYARKRGGKTMADKLSAEILDAFNNQGGAFKRKEDMHRMAEANRAFAHFRF